MKNRTWPITSAGDQQRRRRHPHERCGGSARSARLRSRVLVETTRNLAPLSGAWTSTALFTSSFDVERPADGACVSWVCPPLRHRVVPPRDSRKCRSAGRGSGGGSSHYRHVPTESQLVSASAWALSWPETARVGGAPDPSEASMTSRSPRPGGSNGSTNNASAANSATPLQPRSRPPDRQMR